MIHNDKLLEQFAQAGISESDIENLLSDTFIILDELYRQFAPKEVQHRPGSDSQLSDTGNSLSRLLWCGFGKNSPLDFC